MALDAANFRYDHPRGPIWGFISERGLRVLRLPAPGGAARHVHFLHSAPNIIRGHTLRQLLEQYFAGMRPAFAGIPLDLGGTTPFQQRVWAAAQTIPWGETRTYSQLAAQIGQPTAYRAVASALAANPVHLLIPCHRVRPAQGGLGGFAAGTDWKRELLELEAPRAL